MVNTLKLPVGIDSFEKIRRNGFYYIDKTNLIEQILMNWGEVTLFTRPRRFGKTLNMSMLKSFFEIGADAALFEGLYIAKNKELCDAYMGKYPVIFLTLKGVEGLTFADAKRMLGTILANEMDRHYYLKTSDALTDEDKAYFAKMLTGTDENIKDSIRKLSQLLYKHHGKKAVIIIDEYDVPLDKAYQNGYYREMVSLIRGLFGQALKTNDYLQFAFLTGCLRVSKESIFTGLNNFKVLSIMDSRFDEQFGFTDVEVKNLLASYGLASHFPETKEWYDGYHFGNADVYCPWDVINYVDELNYDQTVEPQDYWSNSSGNAIVRRLIDKADVQTKDEIERNEAEAIAQVYDGSGYTFTLLAGKYQAGCFAVDTDAQTVHFQFRLLFGNQWTDFQHVCLQDGALFSVEVQRIVFEEGAPLRHALTHHPSGTV